MSAPMIVLGNRFQAMKLKDIPDKMGILANDSRLDEQLQPTLFTDPSLDKDKLQAKDLVYATSLQKLMQMHYHASSYVKKCTCLYCQQHPVRLLPPDHFSALHFLPLPLLHTPKGTLPKV